IAEPEPTLATLKEPDAIRALLVPARTGAPAEQREAREKIRMLVFREAEAILCNDGCPVIPVYFYVHAGLIRDYVRGFRPEMMGPDVTLGLRDLWIEGRRGARE